MRLDWWKMCGMLRGALLWKRLKLFIFTPHTLFPLLGLSTFSPHLKRVFCPLFIYKSLREIVVGEVVDLHKRYSVESSSPWTFWLVKSLRAQVKIFFSFNFFLSKQKNKRQSAYNGIRYDKLDDQKTTSLEVTNSTKLLIAAGDIELNHEKLQKAYEEMHASECENDDDDDEMDEETRFINKNRSSFYTSSERTWAATIINSQQIIL